MHERRTAVRAEAPELAALLGFVAEFWSAAALPGAEALAFQLVLEEVFMNVVMHGVPAGTVARVEASLGVEGGVVTLTVEDDALPFDPLSLPAPDVAAGLEERPVGKLGVFLLRQMMDSVSYARVGARNRLTLCKRIAGAPAAP